MCKKIDTRGYKPPDAPHVLSMLEGEQSCKLEHYRTKQDNWPYGYLAIGTHGWLVASKPPNDEHE